MDSQITIEQTILNDCWNKIGVGGDRTCKQLKTYIHCRNCPVYSAAGRGLLERDAPGGYIDEWTNLFSQTQFPETVSQIENTRTQAVIIFRLGIEWLALSANLFKEVTAPTIIHTIPHRSNDVLRGIVNIRGEILMCISLTNLLGLEIPEKIKNAKTSAVSQQRMVVVEKNEDRWVFGVDEVSSIQRFHPHQFRPAPAVVSQSKEAFTKSVIPWQNKKVSYLDDELLFYTINRRIS